MEQSIPKILKVKDEDDDNRFTLHPNLPQCPCLILLIGSVRSGKSNLIVNMFCNDSFYKDKFDTVKIVSTTAESDAKGKILAKHFDLKTMYNDSIIDEIIAEQGEYDKKDRPKMALVLDDVLTRDFSRHNKVSFFSTRFRHFLDMYLISVQSFRAISGMIRNNATNVIICRLQNAKELEKVIEEYGPMVGGEDNFRKLYFQVHKEPYQFLYLDLQHNPARVLKNFEEVIYEGTMDLVE